MIQRAYYRHDELEMEVSVLSCVPDDEERYHVILDTTLFHPQGGGQPSDTGTIGKARMLKAVNDEGNVVHLTDGPLPLGKIRIAIDATPRHLNTRYHSAGHLIGVSGEKYGWSAIKGEHRPGEARVVFAPSGEIRPAVAENFEADVAELVKAALPRHQSDEDGKRIVTWGELPSYACGGTHVVATSDVGHVRITKIKQKKGQLSVHYEVE